MMSIEVGSFFYLRPKWRRGNRLLPKNVYLIGRAGKTTKGQTLYRVATDLGKRRGDTHTIKMVRAGIMSRGQIAQYYDGDGSFNVKYVMQDFEEQDSLQRIKDNVRKIESLVRSLKRSKPAKAKELSKSISVLKREIKKRIKELQ